MLCRVLLTTLGLVWLAAGAEAVDPGSSIGSLRVLPPEKAREGLPVRVEGVVTYFDRVVRLLFISDGRDGIFVRLPAGHRLEFAPSPGDRVLIEGVSEAGDFLPVIAARRIEKIASGPLPEPRQVTGQDLLVPALDCQWVEVRAVV